MTVPGYLGRLLREQVTQVDERVRGVGGYRHDSERIRTAVAHVGPLCRQLGLRRFVRTLNPGTGKPQVLLVFRDPADRPVVLKVYGHRRPNEAAVQRLWARRGVTAATDVLESGEDPVSWLVMPLVGGTPPTAQRGPSLTERLARIMRRAHRVHDPGVGEYRGLYEGIESHLRIVLDSARAHGYQVRPDVPELAREWMAQGTPTFVHGDLAPANLLCDDRGRVAFLDTCGYTGPAEFDAARWCARVGGPERAVRALERWLEGEPGLDRPLAGRLLGIEMFFEAGVREIRKDERGLPWADRDPGTLARLALAGQLVDGVATA